MIDAKSFLSVMRQMVEQQTDTMSSDAVCEIESVNADGTLNIYILPDRETIVRNIINESRYDFKRGDNALLYKIRNRLSDSFVIAKFRPSVVSGQPVAQTVTSVPLTAIATSGGGGATITLLRGNITNDATAWTQDTVGYYTDVVVDGLRESDAPVVDIDINSVSAQGVTDQEQGWSKIYKMTALDGKLRVYATSVPGVAMAIKMMVVR